MLCRSKGVVLQEGTKRRTTSPCPASPKICNTSDPGKQLHQLLTTRLNNYTVANDCGNSQLWNKVIKICDMDPIAATYIEPESFNTPLHLACRILECSTPSVSSKAGTTTSPVQAIRVLIRCCPESVSKTDVDGYIPLHYIIPHSRRTEISHQKPTQEQQQTNRMQNQALVLNLLISADYHSSMKYLSRSDVTFSPYDRACTPLYHAVFSIRDDFLQQSCPTVDLISSIHAACPGTVSVKNRDNQDTPLALLYRRFSRQFDLSKKEFAGDKPRKEVLQHQMRYKTSAMNTWKIILKLLIPMDSEEERGKDGLKQSKRKQNASDFYIVHSAVKMECPPDLIRYIIETRPSEVSKTDEMGRLPLHIAAITTHLSSSDGKSNVGGKHHSKFIIEELLHAYPEGAALADKNGKLPLQLAIESGKFWIEGGAKSIYDAFPGAMANVMVEECPEIIEDDSSISMARWRNCISN